MGCQVHINFLLITQWDTHGMAPLDEGSNRHRGLYLTTHNNHKRESAMPGFEPAVPATGLP